MNVGRCPDLCTTIRAIHRWHWHPLVYYWKILSLALVLDQYYSSEQNCSHPLWAVYHSPHLPLPLRVLLGKRTAACDNFITVDRLDVFIFYFSWKFQIQFIDRDLTPQKNQKKKKKKPKTNKQTNKQKKPHENCEQWRGICVVCIGLLYKCFPFYRLARWRRSEVRCTK